MADPNAVFMVREGVIALMQYALQSGAIRFRLVTGTALGETSVIGDVTTNELPGGTNGYPAGGIVATYGTSAYDAADDRVESTMNGSLIANGGDLTWRQAAITLNNGSDTLLGVLQWPADETLTNGQPVTFSVKLNAADEGVAVNLVDT